jgi:hypothetical protein
VDPVRTKRILHTTLHKTVPTQYTFLLNWAKISSLDQKHPSAAPPEKFTQPIEVQHIHPHGKSWAPQL